MKLYKVRNVISFDYIIQVEEGQDPLFVANRVLKEAQSNANYNNKVSLDDFKGFEDLPWGWTGQSLPYKAKVVPKELTIAQILNGEDK